MIILFFNPGVVTLFFFT